RVGQHHLHGRRGFQGGGREAQGDDDHHHHHGPAAPVTTPFTHVLGANRMHVRESVKSQVGGAMLAAGIAIGMITLPAMQLPLAPIKDFGQSITPAYEGWYRMPDG